MSDLRIVFAYRYGLLGGVSAQLLNRFPWLSSEFDVHVLYEKDHGMARRFPPGVARVTATQAEMEAAIDNLDPDLLLVIDSPGFLDAWSAAGLAGKARAGGSHHDCKSRIPERSHRGNRDLGLRNGERLHASSARRAGLDRLAPIHVVPNCLDSRWFEELEPPVAAEPALLWLGKLDAHKRWRAAADVMDDVLGLPDTPDATPLFVGGYTAPATEIQAFLRRIHSSTQLKHSTWWPYVDYERMPMLYSSVAASNGGLLMTTRNESFGMAAAEAVLMRCPVIAPRVGALPEILPSEALYEPDDWRQVRSKVRRMLADESWRSELTEETRDQVRQTVHPRRALERFGEAIDAIV